MGSEWETLGTREGGREEGREREIEGERDSERERERERENTMEAAELSDLRLFTTLLYLIYHKCIHKPLHKDCAFAGKGQPAILAYTQVW